LLNLRAWQKGACAAYRPPLGWSRQPKNSLNRLHAVVDGAGRQFGWGRRPRWKPADDPCRAIKIVALAGQLYATGQLTPDRDRKRYSKNARHGAGQILSAAAALLNSAC